MPRSYIRKTKRGVGGNYTHQDLEKAIQTINCKEMTLNQAGKFFKIPKSTLQLRIKGWKGRKPTSRVPGKPADGGGRNTAIPYEEEARLATALKTMCTWGFGLTRDEVLDIVQEYVRLNNLSVPFKDARPGEDWFLAFQKRHRLRVKKPEPLETARSKQTDPFIVYDFFDKLEAEVRKQFVNHPDNIWNLDETGICHDPTSTRVVGGIGMSAVRQTAGSGRQFTTTLAAVSASGLKLPPLILFKGKKMWEQWISPEAYPHTSYFVSDNGWMTQEVFASWFKFQFLKKVTTRPLLVIYDGHLSHISIQIIELALQESVTILKLPSHTTHMLQPLDVCVFKPFKTKWDSVLAEWQRSHYGKTLGKSELAALMGKVWPSMTVSNIKSGFKTSGIYDEDLPLPVNRNAIPIKVYDPVKLKRYHASKATGPSSSGEGNLYDASTTINSSELPQTSSSTNMIEVPVIQSSQNGTPTVTESNSETTSADVSVPSISPKTSTSFEELLLSKVKQKPSQSSAEVKRKKKMNVAEVITREEYLENLRSEKQEKQEKKSKEGSFVFQESKAKYHPRRLKQQRIRRSAKTGR